MFYIIGVEGQHWSLCFYSCSLFQIPKCSILLIVNFIYFTSKNLESILFLLKLDAEEQHVQLLTLVQHGCELHGSTSTWIFSVNTVNVFLFF